MISKCVIPGCESKMNYCEKGLDYPMFPLPKNADIRNKWLQNIDSCETVEKLKNGSLICIKHFDDQFIDNNRLINEQAIPTLNINKGNTLVDYEELIAQKPPVKKKRGTKGLMNLQIARKKKLMRRERMQKLAEKRRLAKLENSLATKVPNKKKSETIILNDDKTSDYFLGERTESEVEKIVISLRLTNLMKNLHDKNLYLLKHPSSIRDSKTYPIFNKIKNNQLLLNNPVHWTKEQVIIFIEHITSQTALKKRLESEELDGESILNLTKSDLVDFLKLDENTSEMLGSTFQQLRKETIMRYINS